MAVLKKHLTPIHPTNPRKGHIAVHQGKGATEQTMANRHAMNTLTAGNPADRTFNNYAKMTPMMNGMSPDPAMNASVGGDSSDGM